MRYHEFQITVANISNEVGSVKNVLSQFFVFLSTPLYLRSCGFGDCSLAFLLPSVSRSPDRLSPFTSSSRCCPPDISSVLADHDEFFELPHLGEAGRLFRDSITAITGSCSQAGIPAWAPP